MCFSAGASFTASAVLGAAGAFTIQKAKGPSQKAFAAIPLVFASQQFAEGVLWLALQHDSLITERISKTVFLLIAQVVWPLLVPFSVLLMEKNESRKKILKLITLLGTITSLYLLFCHLIFPVKAEIEYHHIKYTLDFPDLRFPFYNYFYMLATVASLFISSAKRMKILGLLIVATVIFTKYFYTSYFVSVWCFFGALMSVEIYLIIKKLNENPRKKYFLGIRYLKGKQIKGQGSSS